MELSNGSNGWFRFILDGKLATMYSSGSPEGGSDSSGKGITHCDDFIHQVALNLTSLYFSLLEPFTYIQEITTERLQ